MREECAPLDSIDCHTGLLTLAICCVQRLECCFFCHFAQTLTTTGVVVSELGSRPASVLQPSRETIWQWIRTHNLQVTLAHSSG